MKKYQIFLTYYGTLVTTSIFAWSFFYDKGTQGFVITLLLLPICFYFWLVTGGILKNRNEESAMVKIGKIKLALLIFLFVILVSSLSLLSYSQVDNHFTARLRSMEASKEVDKLRKKLEAADRTKASYESVMLELNQLKNELTKINQNKVFGDSPKDGSQSAALVGFVSLKDGIPEANVYKESDVKSQVVGKITSGTDYIFTQKSPNWYFVKVGKDEGWVNGDFVKRIY